MKLTYFPIGGRAFPIRVALHAAGVPFIDERLTGAALREAKPALNLPLGQVPALTLDDGRVFAQSTALARWAGKKSGLYPKGARGVGAVWGARTAAYARRAARCRPAAAAPPLATPPRCLRSHPSPRALPRTTAPAPPPQTTWRRCWWTR
jgi:glutathione S-transferase